MLHISYVKEKLYIVYKIQCYILYKQAYIASDLFCFIQNTEQQCLVKSYPSCRKQANLPNRLIKLQLNFTTIQKLLRHYRSKPINKS